MRAWMLRCIALFSLLTGLCAPAAFAAPAAVPAVDREQLAEAIRQILRDDPNLVLDVLRDNSELVLDIAQQGSNLRRLKILSAQWKKELDVAKPVVLRDRPIRGDEKAPVTIVAFSDFTCPYCAQAANTLNTLLRDNPEKVRMVFKHFPLPGHKAANLAAEYYVAATFQGADKAWKLYDLLFKQSDNLNEGGEALLKRLAEEAGLDTKKLAADLRGNAQKIKTIIEEDTADAKQLGLQGTPNFLVNNLIVRGALAPELFAQAIGMAYDHARNRPVR